MYVLANDRYVLNISPVGTGYSACKDYALTRWSADPVEDNAGFFIYVRDLTEASLWSLGHQPLQRPAEHYAVRHSQSQFLLERLDQGIESRLAVAVAAEDAVEIRRVTLHNRSDNHRRLELTSYLEVVLAPAAADAAHPAFAKLFVETEALPEQAALLASRRPRGATEQRVWMGHSLMGNGPLHYTTERSGFLGRNRSLAAPLALTSHAPLASATGSVLDPIFSLRRLVDLAPGASIELNFLLAAADSRDAVLALLARYANPAIIDKVFSSPLTVAENDAPKLSDLQSINYRYLPAANAGEESKSDDEPLSFNNGYGGFSEDGTEYVIHVQPDATGQMRWPPKPWINVIANETLGCLISESGAGYTWSRNSREHRLTPWYNDPVLDPYGEALYIRDEDTKQFWSPMPGPITQKARYEVRHGFGYTRFRHVSQDIEQEVTVFVPRHDPLKIVRLHLVNRSGQMRRLSLFSYHRLVLGGLPEDAVSVETAWDETAQALLARNPSAGVFSDGVTFATALMPDSADIHHSGDRMAFIGLYGSPSRPTAICGASTLDGKTGPGLNSCAALQVVVSLASHAEIDCSFVLGETLGEDAARELLQRYQQPDAVDIALNEIKAFWRDTVSAVQIKTPSPAIDLMINGWLVYQNLSCRVWGRSAFYQSGGAFGFRDQLQDSSALVYTRPDLVRQQILLHAAHQFSEGDVLHWWHPEPINRGLRTRFADDLLWLPYVTTFYLQTTGDVAILEEVVPFLTAPALTPGEDEVYLQPQDSGEAASLYEHCCRALDRSLTRGAHGLPLMGTGDWNDGMNRIGREGQGESVWLGFFIYAILKDFIPLCEQHGDQQRAKQYRDYRMHLQTALNDTGWDGAWYRRAYYDDGTPLGTAQGDECRIDALAQAWAIISGVAPNERAEQVMDAVAQELVDDAAGLIRLLAPPFDKTPKDPGYIKGYVRGVRENGGQYTHAAMWAIRAFAELGRNNRAAQLLEMLSPVSHSASQKQADCYQVEPYVVAADVYGVDPHLGKGGWTWYTGSAGWMYRVALESVLGVRLSGGHTLMIKPCIPDDWPGFNVTYRLTDGRTRYIIAVNNPDRRAQTVKSATLDGVLLSIEEGAVRIPLIKDGNIHSVEVILGTEVRN